MNIAIDMSITAGFRTGTEEYIEGLVYGLCQSGIGVVAVGRPHGELSPGRPNLGLETRRSPSPIAKWWWEYYGARRTPPGVELLHIPFMAHPEARLAVPSVVTVHDLIPYRLNAYRRGVKEQRYFSHIEKALPYADRLVSISQATFADIEEFFPHLAAKTTVIPNGVHPDFFQEPTGERISQTARRYGLRRRPRVLYVGGYDERKNVGTLLKAMREVFRVHRGGELVLVGAQDNLLVRRQVAQGGIDARVVVTPFVSRSDLVDLYNDADVFVYPSRYEGFGLPPAQALAAGVPVVASDIAPIREVVGKHGILVASELVEEWTTAINMVLDSDSLAQKLAESGQGYAEIFSWPRIAQEYINVYREAIGGR